MTDRPYTDDDLRAEATRQLALRRQPGFNSRGIGNEMKDQLIPSSLVDLEPETGEALEMGRAWGQLGDGDYARVLHELAALMNGAADVSEWAVHLGADGLEPLGEQLTAHTDGGPWFRLHFAVRPDMPDDMRRALVEGVALEIAKHFPNA
ncbi:hypothetical protein ACIGCZ_29290 [Streptomyces nigra]|uniref:hypothetical protein n=1 Tax=Streptomyces nigra TaxID=1827580 RepID=UPI0037D7A634